MSADADTKNDSSSVPKVALITGITGQDGSYLTELLLAKGYDVHGIIRRSSSHNTSRIDHLFRDRPELKSRLFLHYGDLNDMSSLTFIIRKAQPTEIYNLGAMSHVGVSFEIPEYSGNVDGLGTLRLLEAIRICGLESSARFYQASTSELFGKVQETPQRETTPFYPRSPYAVAKQYAYWIVVNYREAYNMFACNGILFNHESPRRGPTFVTRKVTLAAARIKLGLQECLRLGNLDSQRDWGHARDYVNAMWMMLQAETPQDFVCGTGVTQTVRLLVERAFFHAGKTITWQGTGVDEIGLDETGATVVKIDPAFFRPTEVELLLSDPSKIKRELGWECQVSFDELVKEMVEADLQYVTTQPASATD